ncbi:MAG: long-chain fatty acid--CoA ligase [Xanthobacteraceae bacterium]|nr:long-chain fatty acid--CoA ligase [Xanthobacteraceae bacterium]
MQPNSAARRCAPRVVSLWDRVCAVERLAQQTVFSLNSRLALSDLAGSSELGTWVSQLRGRSVLIATEDQLLAVIAMLELDGMARRIVLCPPDLAQGSLAAIVDAAEANAIVSDRPIPELPGPAIEHFVIDAPIVSKSRDRDATYRTEWVLLTSGTTGIPKLVVHDLASLSAAIHAASAPQTPPATPPTTWATFYDIRRYGGLQIVLRALLGGTSLVLSSPTESLGDFLARAGHLRVTHILGTPTHWRRVLMSGARDQISPRYVRLSGEIADQSVLDELRAAYPRAKVIHAFASTEAGVGFEVEDGREGFPAQLIERADAEVALRVDEGSLRIRSRRVAAGYLGNASGARPDGDGFIDTGDMVEKRGQRYYFVGRRDGVINVGGHKVHPEETEAVLNRHAAVHMSRVSARKNPFTGAIVVADVVLKPRIAGAPSDAELKNEILALSRDLLPPHKVPALVRFVPSLPIAPSGKLARTND